MTEQIPDNVDIAASSADKTREAFGQSTPLAVTTPALQEQPPAPATTTAPTPDTTPAPALGETTVALTKEQQEEGLKRLIADLRDGNKLDEKQIEAIITELPANEQEMIRTIQKDIKAGKLPPDRLGQVLAKTIEKIDEIMKHKDAAVAVQTIQQVSSSSALPEDIVPPGVTRHKTRLMSAIETITKILKGGAFALMLLIFGQVSMQALRNAEA